MDSHGQILTLDNLMLRGRPLANQCCLCCCNEEFVNNLSFFLSVSSFPVGTYASAVWDSLVGSNGLGNIIPIFGIWFQAICCELFGLNITGVLSKILRIL